jgi:hypothetical protein
LQVPLIVAGRDPSARLIRLVNRYPQGCLIPNPSQEEMQDLIVKAQIHLLPSFHSTGIKLKLLNALFNGRHCVVNEEALQSSALETACHVAKDAADFRRLIGQLYKQPFTADEVELRKKLLSEQFDNTENAQRLMESIW